MPYIRLSTASLSSFIANCALILTLAASTSSHAGQASSHSQVEVRSSKVGEQLHLDFVVSFDKHLMANWDGPWELKITKPEGLHFDTMTLRKGQAEKALPGFKLVAKLDQPGKSASFTYKLRTFTCTKDKKMCYVDAHEASYQWPDK